MSELSIHIASRPSGFDATTGRVGAAVRAVAERTQAFAVASEAHQP
jgi:hypothetical protein